MEQRTSSVVVGVVNDVYVAEHVEPAHTKEGEDPRCQHDPSVDSVVVGVGKLDEY